MKEVCSKEKGGKVYGFVVSGMEWMAVVYDGKQWVCSEEVNVVCGGMEKDKERWLGKCGMVVEMLWQATNEMVEKK